MRNLGEGMPSAEEGGVLEDRGLVRRGSTSMFAMNDHFTHNPRLFSNIITCRIR
jgi:hypothetical protein